MSDVHLTYIQAEEVHTHYYTHYFIEDKRKQFVLYSIALRSWYADKKLSLSINLATAENPVAKFQFFTMKSNFGFVGAL